MSVLRQATTRLSTLETLPVSKLLGFGAKYLTEFHSPWAQQQGGYVRSSPSASTTGSINLFLNKVSLVQEKAFESDAEEDV